MRIAVLGWGSLIWDPRELQVKGGWQTAGPVLPIEFARISDNRRLTLVIYPAVAKQVPALWAESGYDDLNRAIENLRHREGTKSKNIAYLVVSDPLKGHCRFGETVVDAIRHWGQGIGVDAVVWADLPENFRAKMNKDFSEVNAVEHLRALTVTEKDKAREYIEKAPAQIETPVRRRVRLDLDW